MSLERNQTRHRRPEKLVRAAVEEAVSLTVIQTMVVVLKLKVQPEMLGTKRPLS